MSKGGGWRGENDITDEVGRIYAVSEGLLTKRIEYIIEGNLLEKSVISFYRKSKINIKRKPNYEIGWFHN